MLIKNLNTKTGKYVVTFRILAEQLPEDISASHINIVASFNNWSISESPMTATADGGFETEVELDAGQYEYRYLINDHHWYNDWNADGYSPNRLQNADNCLLILDEVASPAVETPVVKEAVVKAAPAPKKTKSKKSGKDDLKKIEGIGPKISTVLADSGVTTFAQLAAMSVDEIKDILTGKVRIFHPGTWPEQAALAAADEWDQLAALQDQLSGGRRA